MGWTDGECWGDRRSRPNETSSFRVRPTETDWDSKRWMRIRGTQRTWMSRGCWESSFIFIFVRILPHPTLPPSRSTFCPLIRFKLVRMRPFIFLACIHTRVSQCDSDSYIGVLYLKRKSAIMKSKHSIILPIAYLATKQVKHHFMRQVNFFKTNNHFTFLLYITLWKCQHGQ